MYSETQNIEKPRGSLQVGVLRVNASDATRIDLVDPISKERVASDHGTVTEF